MILEEFIKNTLISIVNGTKEANKVIKDGGYSGFFVRPDDEGEILFDIAIIAKEGSKKTGGGGIQVYAFKIGGEKGNINSQENVSRIKFKISPEGHIG